MSLNRSKSTGVFYADICINGKRMKKSLKTSNRKLAEKIYSKIHSETIEGIWFKKSQPHTLEEMLEKAYPKGYSKSLVEYLGNTALIHQVTPGDVSKFKEWRSSRVSPASVNRDLATLKHSFNLAIREWEWVRENPVTRIKLLKEPPGRDRWLTDEEEQKLLQFCPSFLRELVVFALNTGMRLGEIISLEWKGVDLFRRTVTILHSKNGLKKVIPMNDPVFSLLKEKSKVRLIKNEWVFPNSVGGLWDKTKIDKIFRRILLKTEIEDFRFHDLRHTFATRLVQSGVDLYKIQKLLGHKSPLMTQRYSHLMVENLKDAVQSLCPKNVPLKEIEIAESV